PRVLAQGNRDPRSPALPHHDRGGDQQPSPPPARLPDTDRIIHSTTGRRAPCCFDALTPPPPAWPTAGTGATSTRGRGYNPVVFTLKVLLGLKRPGFCSVVRRSRARSSWGECRTLNRPGFVRGSQVPR